MPYKTYLGNICIQALGKACTSFRLVGKWVKIQLPCLLLGLSQVAVVWQSLSPGAVLNYTVWRRREHEVAGVGVGGGGSDSDTKITFPSASPEMLYCYYMTQTDCAASRDAIGHTLFPASPLPPATLWSSDQLYFVRSKSGTTVCSEELCANFRVPNEMGSCFRETGGDPILVGLL